MGNSNLSILDYHILSMFHYFGSPLSYHTLIFDLMRNMYIYNACISIHSISGFSVYLLMNAAIVRGSFS